MHPNALRHRDSGGHEHRRPDQRVKTSDVLTDEMQIRGPELLVIRTRESRRREIIRQRLEPDVLGMILAAGSFAREGDAPRKSAATSRHILKAGLDERENLV